MTTWKRDFASGLIVLVPLIVTGWMVYWLYGWITRLSPTGRVVDNPLLEVFLTLAIFALFVLAVGYLMRTALGRLLANTIDNAMNRVPGLRVVYNASKMGIETALSDSTILQEPVKLHTWDNIRMTAFKTGRTAPDDRVLLFLPTAPNITSGFVIEVDEDDIIEVDETVEDALTRILSAGFGERRADRGIHIAVEAEGGSRSAQIPVDRDGTDPGQQPD